MRFVEEFSDQMWGNKLPNIKGFESLDALLMNITNSYGIDMAKRAATLIKDYNNDLNGALNQLSTELSDGSVEVRLHTLMGWFKRCGRRFGPLGEQYCEREVESRGLSALKDIERESFGKLQIGAFRNERN